MEQDTAKPNQPTWQWDLLVGALPVLALTPLLIYQSASLWSRDHMHFFPLVLVVVGLWVVMSLRGAREARHPMRVWSAISLLVVGALFYIYAVWQFSPWFAHLALLFFFAAWTLGRLGQKHWASIAGWTALLATTLPWPWGWDQGFSNWLQTSGAWCTAKALDALNIPCLQNGSSIETRGLHLIADEICGGLASVYAFGAFAILLGLVLHSGFIVALKTVLLVPLWTLLGHFMRLGLQPISHTNLPTHTGGRCRVRPYFLRFEQVVLLAATRSIRRTGARGRLRTPAVPGGASRAASTTAARGRLSVE